MKHFADIITLKAKACTPLQAIRLNCLECEGSPKGVRECVTTGCSLYEFRMGHRPKRAKPPDPVITARHREFAATARAVKVKREMLNNHLELF